MLGGQPVVVLRDNVERTKGHEAQQSNILAAKAIASAVRTTLGPRGMDKMLVTGSGDVTITNDGATILRELSVQHPGAKMMVEVAETQDDEVGDGTTTACILGGAMMEQAGTMLTKEIHPTIIAEGYRMGMEKALEILTDLTITVTPADRDILVQIASTSMTGKSIESVKEKVAGIIVDAVSGIAEEKKGQLIINEDDVMVTKEVGETMDDAELVKGVVINKKRVADGMPRRVENARIALIAQPLEITKTQVKSKIKISESEQLTAFGEQERESLKKLAETIRDAGANVVLCQKGIADAVQYYLAKFGIFAVEDVKENDLKFTAKAVGSVIVNKVQELSPEMIGTAGYVEQIEDTELVKIAECPNPKAVTILLRGSTQHLIDELERAVEDARRVVQDALEDGTFVVGGGSVETEILLKVRDYASTVGGRTQIALEAFSNVFEEIPKTLAENSGFDPIDKIVALKQAHANGEKFAGLNVYTGEIIDMKAERVFEPARVKKQAIMSAAEMASMLIRVDDMFVTVKREGGAGPVA
ncbi:thermosome subunit alpha [Methanofollis fontis]|uniref:Thermosome subunit n=1 Tax=Methanofollis fontis TaxID=2052832 RepID=A0A483CWX1_9EURY|nr:thermosome subunit alpha [Methanofollis fontis]TAJ45770.1 thermosome subunit [Methanofollis fontis]